MTPDRLVGILVSRLHQEQEKLRQGVMGSTSLTLEEFRRLQGRHDGLSQAMELLKDVLEETDK